MAAQKTSVPSLVLGRGLSLKFSLLLHLLVIALVISSAPCVEAKIKFIKQEEWGAAPATPPKSKGNEKGVKVHYEGEKVSELSHPDGCAEHLRGIQSFHMKERDWSDIAYNLAVCQHGYVYEGRGVESQSGANGNQELNQNHFAVVGFIGDEGVTEPSRNMTEGIREAIAYLRKKGGAGKEIKGHKDGYSTSCPGPALYKLVENGGLEPGNPKKKSKSKTQSKTQSSKKPKCTKPPRES